MRKPLFIAGLAALVIGSFVVGSWYGQRDRAIEPGIAPVGEASQPVPAGGTVPADAASEPPGAVQVNLEKRQLIGLKTAVAEKRSGSWPLRLLGRVAVDESRLYTINATVDGWITEASSVVTGTFVKRHQVLGSFYSPEFLSAEQALLFALSSDDRVRTTGRENPAQKDQLAQYAINLQQYKDSLRNLGMGEKQIEELIRKREYMENIHITAPADGFVTARYISLGLRFNKGQELFKVADLGRVWVLAETYESEVRNFAPGTAVKISLPKQDKTFEGRVSSTLPQFDAATRTLKVRLEAANPQYALKPDMFVDVEIPVAYPPAITVPVDAVMDSGLKKTIFVDRGDGFFEPREVETGARYGERVEIIRGISEGERIVVSGNFLLDSESRMQLAALGVYGTLAKDPACGRDVSVRKAEREGLKSIHDGRTWYFSSAECKERFDREPGRYTGRPADGVSESSGR